MTITPCTGLRSQIRWAWGALLLATVAAISAPAFGAPAVTNPNDPGITLVKGETYHITWTGFTGSSVKLQLFKGGNYVTRIGSDITQNDGSYEWAVPTGLKTGPGYQVKIISASNSSQTDFSDNPFTIGNVAPGPTPAGPQVHYPSNAGITVKRGDLINITWTGFTGSSVKLQLFKGNRYVTRIGADITPNNGRYEWTLPARLRPGANYRVKIISASNSSQTDFSDNPFSVVTHFLLDWPVLENKPPVDAALVTQAEEMAQTILNGLTLDQKIGQITQGEIQSVSPADVAQYCLGSVLNGGGSWPNLDKNSSPQDWRDLADAYWQAGMNGCGIPPIWGIDSVHGNNNVIGATLFPHNIGLGAANNPELINKIGAATAKETRVTGQPWAFAPTVAVARDDRWGRTYESYSEDPQRVARLTGPMIAGLQGNLGECNVAATIKHWVGDGGTTNGKDQGNTEVTEEELINLHALAYFEGMKVGVLSAMPSFSSWNGEKMHGHQYLIQDILKDTLGFSGHIISDWNGIGQVTDNGVPCTNSNCPKAVNAGIDLFMVPFEWPQFMATTKQQVEAGIIPLARIDDAVKRILRNKILLGLFEKKPSAGECAVDSLLGKQEHRDVARQAVRESLVLLKNDGNILPLSRNARILVTGKSAHNLPNQSGGWTITWQGTGITNDDFPGATSIYEGIKSVAPHADLVEDPSSANLAQYDVAIVAIGEPPYAEGLGDIRANQTLEHARLHPEDLQVLQTLHNAGVPVVTLWVAGRPLYVNKELNRSDAFVAAWLPGSEGSGIADVIFRKGNGGVNYDFTGTLSFSWPAEDCQTPLNAGQQPGALFPYAFGLTYQDNVVLGTLDETSGDRGCGLRDGDGGGGGGVATVPLEVFVQGGNIDPWVLQLGDPSNWGGTAVDLSDPNKVTALLNISAGPRVDSPTFQSGAIKVTWKGGAGQVYSQGAGGAGEDLSAYINALNSALVFNVRSNTAPTAKVTTRIDCVFPCLGELDLTAAYTSISDGQWHELAVPLSCFENPPANGSGSTDFSNVNTPFLVFTEGQWAPDFATIRWEPDYDSNVTCNGQYQP